MNYQRCNLCHEWLPVTSFPTGMFHYTCTACLTQEEAEDARLRRRYEAPHLRLWEEAYGPVPPTHRVTFVDGNRDNCVLENLRLLTPQELQRLAHGWECHNDVWTRLCPCCGRRLPLKFYYKSRPRGRCIPCSRQYAREYLAKSPSTD